jgi:hypothetical protein
MPKRQKGKITKLGNYSEGILVLVPLLTLLGTGLLHWTMQVFLESNLLVRLSKLVGLPFYILFVVLAPPLVLAWGMYFLCRRSDIVFGVVLLVVLIPWGFWYLIPPILENWDAFSRFVEDFGAV